MSTAPPFPTTLSDLQPLDRLTSSPTLYSTLRTLRRAALSPHNRLRSILHDSAFVTRVARHFGLPLIANERCGAWYIPPPLKRGSVYFKSTDGHHGQWDFSLRRLNLGLLDVLGREGGAVLVDSTRRGKAVSDALGKTVVVWVAVVNRCLFPGVERGREVQWGEGLVGASERSLVEGRVAGWCEGLCGLGVDLDGLGRRLKRPIRVAWAVNGVWEPSDHAVRREEGWNLLVLCSASRRVRGAEISEGGYVQGAGDDSEGWSCGLTPRMFWEHKDELLGCSDEEYARLVAGYERETAAGDGAVPVQIPRVGRVYICAGRRDRADGFGLVINCNGSSQSLEPGVLDLHCREGKLGSNDLRKRLSSATAAAEALLKKSPSSRILITCCAGRDLSVGTALALICLFYDEEGNVYLDQWPRNIDKLLVRKRLVWITDCKPDANPSRATLQAVNSALMDRPA